MQQMFRKRQAAVADDEIPEDILASIPDLDESGPNEAPVAAPAKAPSYEFGLEARPAWKPTHRDAGMDREVRNADVDVSVLVAEVRRSMDTVFSRELSKVEDSFGSKLRQMEGLLAQAQAELDSLRGENQNLHVVKADYERKIHALKDLTRTIEKL